MPKSYLSWFVGTLAHIPLPWPLNVLSIRIFAGLYKIDCDAASNPVSSFRSIGEFFTRDLKPELRPIAGDICSPVDGTLRQIDSIPSEGLLTQIKGQTYTVSELLGGDERWREFIGGAGYLLYLSPQDAHHIFSPVTGRVVETVHIPGKLWPVNSWAVNTVPNLFAVNERIVSVIESEFGKVAVVMVGATNVGKISLSYFDIVTNLAPWRRESIRKVVHHNPIQILQGEKLGTFHLGSTVVLLTQRGVSEELVRRLLGEESASGISIKYGANLFCSPSLS